MTLAQLNTRMRLGVQRTDLTADGVDDYSVFLNQAQREICRLHSFVWMKTTATVIILAGASSAALPATFKELTRAKSPVHLVGADATTLQTPVDVWPLEKVKRRNRAQLDRIPAAVAVDRSVNPPELTTGAGTSDSDSDLTFSVQHYAFPADLVADADYNRLTTEMPEMLLAKAKAIAFAAVNDAAAVDFEQMFQFKFRETRQADTLLEVAGVDLRM